jgi:hypothetical protein
LDAFSYGTFFDFQAKLLLKWLPKRSFAEPFGSQNAPEMLWRRQLDLFIDFAPISASNLTPFP